MVMFKENAMNGKISQKPVSCGCALYDMGTFQEAIQRENTRSVRSGKSFLLVLVDVSNHGSGKAPLAPVEEISAVLSSSTREIDAKGWYIEGEILGILFSEFGSMGDSVDAAATAILGRLYNSLSGMIGEKDIRIAPYAMPAGIAVGEPRPASLR